MKISSYLRVNAIYHITLSWVLQQKHCWVGNYSCFFVVVYLEGEGSNAQWGAVLSPRCCLPFWDFLFVWHGLLHGLKMPSGPPEGLKTSFLVLAQKQKWCFLAFVGWLAFLALGDTETRIETASLLGSGEWLKGRLWIHHLVALRHCIQNGFALPKWSIDH